MTIKNRIMNELIDLGLEMNGEYFMYWYQLLLADYHKSFKDKNTMTKYSYLAKKNNNNINAVERILRYGKKMMEKQIIKKYNINTKITNETVIVLFELMVF